MFLHRQTHWIYGDFNVGSVYVSRGVGRGFKIFKSSIEFLKTKIFYHTLTHVIEILTDKLQIM